MTTVSYEQLVEFINNAEVILVDRRVVTFFREADGALELVSGEGGETWEHEISEGDLVESAGITFNAKSGAFVVTLIDEEPFEVKTLRPVGPSS